MAHFITVFLLILIGFMLVDMKHDISMVRKQLNQTSDVLVECPNGQYVFADAVDLTIIHASS